MLSREWRYSWSRVDRRCTNYIWVINNFIAYYDANYIRCLTVLNPHIIPFETFYLMRPVKGYKNSLVALTNLAWSEQTHIYTTSHARPPTLWENTRCHTLIWGNTMDMDRILVIPVGWNWRELYPWLLPNEIRRYLGRTVTSMATGIVQVQNRSLGGQFSQICLCTVASSHQQLHVIYQFSLIVLIMSRPTPIGIKHEVLVLVHEGMRHGCDLCYCKPHLPEACCHWC